MKKDNNVKMKEDLRELEKKLELNAENKKDEGSRAKDEASSIIKDSPIRQVGSYLLGVLIKYKYLLILDFVVFLFLFFVVPMVIFEVKPFIWMSLFLIVIILPTSAFYLKKLFQKYQIVLGIPFFYLCILCVLDKCTIKDLYGITSHGTLDKSPAWLDAILVTFIIVFFQYVGLTIIDGAKKCLKFNKK